MDPELAETLRTGSDRLAEHRAVLLPDLFVDHLVPVERMTAFRQDLDRVLRQGGGNVLLRGQRLKIGGNAANTAHALARLGVSTTLFTQTDPVGRTLWQDATRGLPVSDDGIVTVTSPSTTVALELQEESANLMLSDPGPLAHLGPEDLDERVWSTIEQADLVAVTNWAQTLRHGTRLLAEVVRHAQTGGTFTFLDTGDPAHRGEDTRNLLQDDGILQGLDAWGMNEHEARWFAGHLLECPPDQLDVETAAEAIAQRIQGRVDVHTHEAAMSIQHGRRVRVPAFPAPVHHRTGAGDAWNAGNLAGTLLGLAPSQRLTLAHATATLTLTGELPGPPDLHDVIRFIDTPGTRRPHA